MSNDPSPVSPSAETAVLAGQMKLGMRQWASGVSVIAACDAAGNPHAMTASSLTSVSDNPPSLLVCVNQKARMASLLEVTGTRFSANLLGSGHQSVSNICATPDMQEKRFSEGAWDLTGTPFLQDAPAVFECEVAEVLAYGTHLVVIGRIIDVKLGAEPQGPLCYWNGGYQSLA